MLTNIVLDLDECLVRVFTDDVDWSLFSELRKSDHLKDLFKISDEYGKYWGLKRPHLNHFLSFCFKRFDVVAVWSAGATSYVEAIVEHIFRDTKKPHLVMTRDHIASGFGYSYSKPLKFFFEKVPGANRSNTILVDNRKANALYDPHNIVHIPDFEPAQRLEAIKQDDDCLFTLTHWLDQLDLTSDVCDLNLKDIFKDSELSLRQLSLKMKSPSLF